jgi:hypothetical protein
MPETTVQKAARGVSPVLLVLAALCFLLPFAGVSCNTSAGSAAITGALSQLGASGSSANAAASCLQGLNGKDLLSYSGVNMLTGGNPSTVGSIPGCDSSTSVPVSTSSAGGIGVQPLIVVALVFVVVGILAVLLRASLRRSLIAAVAGLVAAVLIIVNNSTVHGTLLSKLTSSLGSSLPSSGTSLPGADLRASVGGFFDIHAAIGFTLVLIALFLAVAVNLAALIAGSGLRMARAAPAGVGPPADAPSGWPSAQPPGTAPPPPPPPPG